MRLLRREQARIGAEPRPGITLAMTALADLPPISADGERMPREPGNVLRNALRLTSAGGTITPVAAAHAKVVPLHIEATRSGSARQHRRRAHACPRHDRKGVQDAAAKPSATVCARVPTGLTDQGSSDGLTADMFRAQQPAAVHTRP
ncbi:MAG TPA: hypothetical protein VFZ66_06495 [Herpetosiphonaceae bacterium]